MGCNDLSDDLYHWVMSMFSVCLELASALDKEHHDRWHPIVWELARQLRHEAEELAWEKARSSHR